MKHDKGLELVEIYVKMSLSSEDTKKAMEKFGYDLYDSRTGAGNFDYKEMAHEVVFEWNASQGK